MELEQLLPVINQLQEVFSKSGLDSKHIQLPQIVVVGEQSAGKSSVLESLVGRPCLPRGIETVTRCPIVLQLIQTTKKADESDADEDYCEFPHLPEGERKITNFDLVVKIINTEVDKNAGTNKGIITDKLVMKIFSPNVINLTIIDLPGMVKHPVGDQPADIGTQIEALLRSYIGNPNSIILAVSPATSDIANSESLKLAKEVDPHLDRTVAVITKLDLMDPGTNAMDVLTGTTLPVKLGIVGVVNRSFEDIQKNKTISDSIEHEAKFLKERYSMIASQNGIPYLKVKLQAILLKHICNCLPELQVRLSSLKNEAVDELTVLGGDASLDKANKRLCLRKIIKKFCDSFQSSITGREFQDMDSQTLTGVAKLREIFEDVLPLSLNTIDPLADLQNEKILNTIANSRPLESGLIVTETAFHVLVRGRILRLTKPSCHCGSLVYEEILKIVEVSFKGLEAEMHRFPKIKSTIAGVTQDLLVQQYHVAQAELEKYIERQASYIAMSQVGFGDEMRQIQNFDGSQTSEQLGSSSNPDIQNPRVEGELPESELAKCNMMRRLVSKYFESVKSEVRNFWPKIVYPVVIRFMEQEIHDQLIEKLYISEEMENLMTENQNMAERRKKAVQNLKDLEKADEVLASIRDITYQRRIEDFFLGEANDRLGLGGANNVKPPH